MRTSKLINTKHWRGTPKAISTDKDIVTPDLNSDNFKSLQLKAKGKGYKSVDEFINSGLSFYK